jgi:hypothetical protein
LRENPFYLLLKLPWLPEHPGNHGSFHQDARRKQESSQAFGGSSAGVILMMPSFRKTGAVMQMIRIPRKIADWRTD